MSFARWQPYYTDRELELDRRIHAFGLLLALIATPLLLGLAAESRRPGLVLPCAIYLLSLLGMLGSSTLFRHTPLRWSKYRWFLRRLDHAAIFLFIAGTYTPFTVGQMHGERVGPTVAVWAGALIGAVYKLAFPVGLRRPSLVAFAALASFVLFGLRPTLVFMAPPAVGLILAGLALYTVGAAIHHRPVPYHTPIWHGFVIVGAAGDGDFPHLSRVAGDENSARSRSSRRLDCRSRSHYRNGQSWAPSDRVRPLDLGFVFF